MNPEIQPTSPLDLAGVAVATPAAGLVKMKVLVCLGVVLICLACVCTRLSWVLGKVAKSLFFVLGRLSDCRMSDGGLPDVGLSDVGLSDCSGNGFPQRLGKF